MRVRVKPEQTRRMIFWNVDAIIEHVYQCGAVLVHLSGWHSIG